MMNLSLINRIKIDASRFGNWCLLDDFDDVNSLVESGWVELDVENDMLSLHHVISDLVYEELKPDAQKCNVFISSLADVVNPKNSNSYYEKSHYLSFCRVVAKRIKGISEGAADFFSEIGRVLSTKESDREECLKYLLKALDAYKNIYGEISVKAADIYLYLAVTYKTLSSSFDMYYDENTDEEVWGKINEYNEKYISICEKLFKEDEDKIAEAYYLAGIIYKELKEHELSIEVFNKSINLWEEYLKFDEYCSEDYCYKEILCCKLKLGQVYEEKNEYTKAEDAYLEAFKLYEKVKVNDNRMAEDILELYECLGNIECEKHNYNKAFHYYMTEVNKLSKSFYKEENERALKSCRKVIEFLGENEKDYKEKLVEVYLSIGKSCLENDLNVQEGLDYYLKGLKISSELFDSKHYISAQFYHKIGNIYCYKLDESYDEGKIYLNGCNYKAVAEHESEKFLEKPIEQFKIFEQAGENYALVDNYKEAIYCFKKALAFISHTMENLEESELSYYDYIRINDRIVINYKELKEYDKALEYEKNSLEIINKSFGRGGSHSPSLYEYTQKYIDIGNLYLEKEDYEETVEYYLSALNYYEEKHDENIDNIIDVFKKIINVYKITENYAQINLYEEKIKELLGNEIEFQE